MPRPDHFTPAPHAARHLPAELLRRYVAGALSPAQEHEVEAHTLECEQCAEVLEGLELQPAAVTDASLTELRQRLHARVAELADEVPAGPAVIPLWWRPLAAAAVLLLTLGAVAWLVLRPVNRPEIAARTTPATGQVRPTNPAADLDGASAGAAESPAAAAVAAAPPAAPDIAAVVPRKRAASPRPAVAPLRDEVLAGEGARPLANRPAAAEVAAEPAAERTAETAVAASTPATYAAAPTADQSTPDNRAAKSGIATRSSSSRAAAAPIAAPAPQLVLAATDAGTGRMVQGRIVDNSGQPLPGATVLVPGTTTGVSTSADGRFALTVPAGSRTLAVSSIGYQPQTRLLQATDTSLMLALVPDSKQLSEVVVVRREAAPNLPSIGPLPAGGYAAFRQYLHDSLNYPEKARDQHVQGTVRLQFVVEADGRLSGIKVVRRLSPECDEEAIRLLKEGPAWFPGVQNSRRTARKVEVNVPFSLEK